MANDSKLFVAIIGGIWETDPAVVADVKQTARKIGEALANAGLGLVVYFSNDKSLEPHVVSGYVAALPPGAGAGSIRVRFAETQRGEVKFAEEATHEELFARKAYGKEWEAPFYRSLVAADGVDAVLLMAGARSTLIAGQIALGRPLPVLAIDKFDGSAGTIRSELVVRMPDYPSASTHTIPQMVAWLKNECEVRAKEQAQAREWEKSYLKVTTQRQKSVWLACAFAILFLGFVFGVAKAPPPRFYPVLMFAALVAAGATGALIRSVLWGEGESTPPSTSLLLGGVAGFVVGLAYLIPQFVGAPKVLEVTTTEVDSANKIQFMSAALVAISAGVGFDVVFNRLKKQAEEQPIGLSGQK
jgi:hypothetical protein